MILALAHLPAYPSERFEYLTRHRYNATRERAMSHVTTTIISASPNFVLDYNKLVANQEIPALGIRHVGVPA